MLGSGGWALNAKQEAFAREYIVDRNGTQAAIRAGYSEKGASVHGSRLLRNVQVRALIDELIAAQFERLDITTDRVFEELAAVAFSNIGRYATVTGDGDVSLFPWSDMPEHGLACVAEISETPNKYGNARRIRMHDKLIALRDIAKLKGIDGDDTPEERAQAIYDALQELRSASYVDPPE